MEKLNNMFLFYILSIFKRVSGDKKFCSRTRGNLLGLTREWINNNNADNVDDFASQLHQYNVTLPLFLKGSC